MDPGRLKLAVKETMAYWRVRVFNRTDTAVLYARWVHADARIFDEGLACGDWLVDSLNFSGLEHMPKEARQLNGKGGQTDKGRDMFDLWGRLWVLATHEDVVPKRISRTSDIL